MRRTWLMGGVWLLVVLPVLAQQTVVPLWTRPAHPGFVGAVAFSPDGRYFASALGNLDLGYTSASVHLWDAYEQKYLATLLPDGDYYDIQALQFSPDSSLLFAGGVETGMRAWFLPRMGTAVQYQWDATAISMSDDGNVLATGSYDGKVRVWKGFSLREWQASSRSAVMLRAALSPDGQWLATILSTLHYPYYFHPGNTVSLWRTDDGTLAWEQSLPSPTISISYSPDGQHLAVGCSGGAIYVLDSITGQVVQELQVPGYNPVVAYSADGEYLAAGAEGDRQPVLRLWRTSDYALINEIPVSDDPVCLAFARHAPLLACGLASGEVEWLSVPTAAYQKKITDRAYLLSTTLSLSPNSKRVGIILSDRSITLNITDGRVVGSIPYGGVVSPDWRWLVGYRGREIFVRRFTDGSPVYTLDTGIQVQSINQVAISPDSRYLCVVDYTSSARVFQMYLLATGQKLWEVSPIEAMSRQVRFSPRSTYVVLLGDKITVRRVSDGSVVFVVQPVFPGAISSSIAFSPDETLLATMVDGRNIVYKLPTGEQVWISEPSDSDIPVYHPREFSANGRYLLLSSASTLQVLDTLSWTILFEWGNTGVRHSIEQVKFTPDSRALVMSYKYGGRSLSYVTVLMFQPRVRLVASIPEYPGIHQLEVSRDSRYIVYHRTDGTIRAVRNPLVSVALPRPPRR